MFHSEPVYATDHAAPVLQTHSWRTVTNSTPYLIPHLRSDMTILDIGCGPGSISVDLARRVPNGHVTGIEYVPDPLDEARSLASREGVTNIDFRVGDIHSLAFPDNSFDLVHVHQVLQHIADPVQALREMRRVAKSNGGIVAARESATFSWYPENQGIQTWHAVTERMAKGKGGHPNPGSYIHTWAQEAGFPVDKIQKSTGTWCFSTPEEREYWGGTMAERTQSSGFTTMVLGGGWATAQELESMARGWREWVVDEQGWFGVLHGEIVCFK
ncbi:putative ubiE/COQ5 methyltransferase [Aspergillus campestris IBT 28561]|uniref:UbiE/COQ5 methyltransferase n=1 Tax=Aspergillus campestris (strain IBT 28561) TaxID=1392248 RepID=A0A2I1D754_ASPC2|nr:putative ubiE/COQ5 methyltransferase [Aspergillus campestris IBT 28561]PKY05701.1 putative ubiE/COQ5 methyltransferase [Aspergillus campestris IBT 28561]